MVQTELLWVPWVALLSAAALSVAWFSWRRGNRGATVTWLGWAMVPWAAFLLGFIALGFRVVSAVTAWVTRFAFNPAAWAGVVVALVAMALIAGGARLKSKQPGPKKSPALKRDSSAAGGSTHGTGDDEIDAILKKRGIG